jgi:hypothetical protein
VSPKPQCDGSCLVYFPLAVVHRTARATFVKGSPEQVAYLELHLQLKACTEVVASADISKESFIVLSCDVIGLS